MSIRKFCFVAVFVVAVVVGQDDVNDNRNNTDVVSDGAGGNLFNDTDTDADAGGNLFNDTDTDANTDGDDFDNDVGGEGTRLTGAEKTVKKGGLFATLISKVLPEQCSRIFYSQVALRVPDEKDLLMRNLMNPSIHNQ